MKIWEAKNLLEDSGREAECALRQEPGSSKQQAPEIGLEKVNEVIDEEK